MSVSTVPLLLSSSPALLFFLSSFFFNDTATTEIYTLSLHDALPILATPATSSSPNMSLKIWNSTTVGGRSCMTDRKSTRLNSSHQIISYAVFCLKKKKNHKYPSKRQFQQ